MDRRPNSKKYRTFVVTTVGPDGKLVNQTQSCWSTSTVENAISDIHPFNLVCRAERIVMFEAKDVWLLKDVHEPRCPIELMYDRGIIRYFDPKERARQKQESRDQDAADLASGKKTPEDLRRENGAFYGMQVRIDWTSGKP